jgi:predicted alpha/beta-hydrolase family hydrolase
MLCCRLAFILKNLKRLNMQFRTSTKLRLNKDKTERDVPIAIDLPEPLNTKGTSNKPFHATGIGALLLHGAGGNMDSGQLPALASFFSSTMNIPTIRFTSKGPLKDLRVKIADHLLQNLPSQFPQHVRKWILVGHSMGSRVATDLAYANHKRDSSARIYEIQGCILLSYPLHPPGQINKLRDHPLLELCLETETPILFVRGTKDTFSTEPVWNEIIEKKLGHLTNIKVCTLLGGDHSLKVPGGKAKVEDAMKLVLDNISKFCHNVIK